MFKKRPKKPKNTKRLKMRFLISVIGRKKIMSQIGCWVSDG